MEECAVPETAESITNRKAAGRIKCKLRKYPAAGLGKILVENLPSDPTNWFPEEIVNDGAKAPAQPGVGFGIDNTAVYLPAVLIPVLAGIGAVIYRKRRTA